MKILPCTNGECRKEGARTPRTGRPYYAETFPGRPGQPLTYRCACGTTNRLWPAGFNALPDLTPADLERYDLLEPFAKSLTFGGALTLDQARQLVEAGFRSVQDLAPLE